jgi:hypothetical protein
MEGEVQNKTFLSIAMNPQEETQLAKVRGSQEGASKLHVLSERMNGLVKLQSLKYDSGRKLQIYLLNAELKKSIDLLQTTLL